jgi:hypothetical protein
MPLLFYFPFIDMDGHGEGCAGRNARSTTSVTRAT